MPNFSVTSQIPSEAMEITFLVGAIPAAFKIPLCAWKYCGTATGYLLISNRKFLNSGFHWHFLCRWMAIPFFHSVRYDVLMVRCLVMIFGWLDRRNLLRHGIHIGLDVALLWSKLIVSGLFLCSSFIKESLISVLGISLDVAYARSSSQLPKHFIFDWHPSRPFSCCFFLCWH